MRESVKEQKKKKRKKKCGGENMNTEFFFKVEMKNIISRHLKFIKCLEEKKRLTP